MSGEIAQSSLALLAVLSIAFGFAAAMVYDIFRIRRIAINIPILWHFEDFFFMVLCGVSFSVIFYAQSSGRVRGFAFALAIGGFYIYRKTLGRLVMAMSEKIIQLVKYIFKKVVLPPVNFVKCLLLRLFTLVKKLVSKICMRILLRSQRRKTKKQIRLFVEAAQDGFVEKQVNKFRKI